MSARNDLHESVSVQLPRDAEVRLQDVLVALNQQLAVDVFLREYLDVLLKVHSLQQLEYLMRVQREEGKDEQEKCGNVAARVFQPSPDSTHDWINKIVHSTSYIASFPGYQLYTAT